jgi:8-oxo-dGTP diphosphatase
MPAKQVFCAYDGQESTHAGLFKYCPFCEKQLTLKDKGGKQRPACPNCGFVQYRNPVPGVVVVIEKEGCVLLGKRRGGVQAGKWCLPQGYIEFEEDFLTAAIREVKEETGLEVEIRSILNVVSNLLSPQLHTLAIVMLARVLAGELCAGDDLESLIWIPNSESLPEMAFEADEWIIKRYKESKREEGLPVDPNFAMVDKVNPRGKEADR